MRSSETINLAVFNEEFRNDLFDYILSLPNIEMLYIDKRPIIVSVDEKTVYVCRWRRFIKQK